MMRLKPAFTSFRVLGAVALMAVAVPSALYGYSIFGKWFNNDVPYYVNPLNNNGLSNNDVVGAIQEGAQAWTNQSGADFRFTYVGPTGANTVGYDGQNNVFFRDESSGGTIAAAYWWWWESTGEIVESDIKFFDAHDFFTGTQGCASGYYVEDIAAHEFGHALGLNHSGSGTTMAPSTSACNTSLRSLSQDDIDAVEANYPPSGQTQPPSTPSGLTANTSSSSPEDTIDLAWNDTSNDEDWFTVERSTDNVNFVQVGQANSNSQAYSDGNLGSGTMYWYRVKAVNSGGASNPSNVDSAQTGNPPTSPPTPPSNLNASNGANPETQINLVWTDNSNNEDSFTIERSLNGTNFLVIGSAGANTTAYTDTGLNSGTTYWYRVRAQNSGGTSNASNVDSAQTSTPPPPPNPPLAPVNPSPGNGAANVSRDADLLWSANSSGGAPDHYDVYFGQSNPPPLHQSGVTSTSLALSKLPPGKTFFWRIVAINGGGSASSATWTFSTSGGGGGSGGGPGNGKGNGKKK